MPKRTDGGTVSDVPEVKLSAALHDRVLRFQVRDHELKIDARALRTERRALCKKLHDCGVPADQIARFVGLTQRTHVYEVLRGKR